MDASAPYWGVGSENWLLVNEASYSSAISDAVPDELRDSMWYIVADGSNLHSGDIAGLDQRIQAIQKQADLLLKDTKLVSSPLDALERYQKNAPYLTYLLYAFSVPILGLILAFIGLVTGLFVGQQRGEMAILRSRGASSAQVVGISMLQGILLGMVALAGGVFLGYWIAHAIGQARSFMDFTATGGLRVSLTLSAMVYGIAGIAIILLAQVLIPTLAGARNTIVTYKQERARLLRAPWWQRYWFDLLLLLPAGYGVWQLQTQSSLALAGKANVPSPLQNPLLLIAPALGIFAVALVHAARGAAFNEPAKLVDPENEKRRAVDGCPLPGQDTGFLQRSAGLAIAYAWTFFVYRLPGENFGWPTKQADILPGGCGSKRYRRGYYCQY